MKTEHFLIRKRLPAVPHNAMQAALLKATEEKQKALPKVKKVYKPVYEVK